ncbi:hypothetical protein Tco_1505005 [Tanacetum coccineum]
MDNGSGWGWRCGDVTGSWYKPVVVLVWHGSGVIMRRKMVGGDDAVVLVVVNGEADGCWCRDGGTEGGAGLAAARGWIRRWKGGEWRVGRVYSVNEHRVDGRMEAYFDFGGMLAGQLF